jgi:exopolysaccharide production protein ExoQ
MSATEVEMNKAPRRTEKVFVVFVLLLSAGAFSSLWTVPVQTQQAAGMLVMQVLWILIYLCTLFLFLRHCDRPFQAFASEWPLVVLCAFAMMSTIWSAVPGLTFRRSVALALTVLFGLYFAYRFNLKEQLRLLAWACAVCVVFSFAFGILELGNSVNSGEGVPGWYGIFDQKNSLGRMMVLSALVFLFLKKVEPENKRFANIGLFGSIALIALSRSMTSVVVFLMLMTLLPYLRWTVRKSAYWMIAGIMFLAAAGTATVIYAAAHMQQVSGLLGRSATLTGRVQIWILSTAMAVRRPWLGYGFNAFWLPSELFTVRIWRVMGWNVPHAHDGLIELWLELGIVGIGLFLLVFVYYVLRGIGFLRRDQGAGAAAWPLVFLVFQFLSNLTEADLLARNSVFFILFVSAAVMTRANLDEAHGYQAIGFAREITA